MRAGGDVYVASRIFVRLGQRPAVTLKAPTWERTIMLESMREVLRELAEQQKRQPKK